MSFGVDSNGNYGYIKAGADSVTPFKTGIDAPSVIICNRTGTNTSFYGILKDSVHIHGKCRVYCQYVGCNNVKRAVLIRIFKNGEPFMTREFAASEMAVGDVVDPGLESSYGASDTIEFESQGDELTFGINCTETGAKASGYSGYPYGIWYLYFYYD